MLRRPLCVAACLFASTLRSAAASPDRPVWPLTLRDGIPARLPGYDPAPRDPLPDTFENEMGAYTEVSRLFQKIEPGAARQFRIAVQDYGTAKNLEEMIRRAVAEAAKTPGVETAQVKIAGLPAYAVTDRSASPPTSLVTVVVTPSRFVLGQGSNVDHEEGVKLLARVDFAKVAAAR